MEIRSLSRKDLATPLPDLQWQYLARTEKQLCPFAGATDSPGCLCPHHFAIVLHHPLGCLVSSFFFVLFQIVSPIISGFYLEFLIERTL